MNKKVRARKHQQPRAPLPPMVQALEEMHGSAHVRKGKASRSSTKHYKEKEKMGGHY